MQMQITCEHPVHVACLILGICIPLFVGVAQPVPADVGPEPPVPASLAAPHALAIDYEGPIASVATFGISVDGAGLTIRRSEN